MDNIKFSTSVSAGTRLFHFDVREDKQGSSYLAITEVPTKRSGRQKRSKIFVYQEDMPKFIEAISLSAIRLSEI